MLFPEEGPAFFCSNFQPRFNIPGPVFAGREAFYDGFVLRTQHGKDVPGIENGHYGEGQCDASLANGLTGEFQGACPEKALLCLTIYWESLAKAPDKVPTSLENLFCAGAEKRWRVRQEQPR